MAGPSMVSGYMDTVTAGKVPQLCSNLFYAGVRHVGDMTMFRIMDNTTMKANATGFISFTCVDFRLDAHRPAARRAPETPHGESFGLLARVSAMPHQLTRLPVLTTLCLFAPRTRLRLGCLLSDARAKLVPRRSSASHRRTAPYRPVARSHGRVAPGGPAATCGPPRAGVIDLSGTFCPGSQVL